MTVGANQLDILKPVVPLVPIQMVKFKRDRLSKPFRIAARLAFRLFYLLPKEANA